MEIVGTDRCCGCRACVQACPKEAVTVITDKYGFEQVQIDDKKCLNCGICKAVCPIINQNKNGDRFSCGSAYCKDESIRKMGSSGGLFGLFSRMIVRQGGVVYGAAFDENLRLRVMRAETINELEPLYKSKYLLCNTLGSFEKIRKDLDTGRFVLYCSSPCQISALKNYLRKGYNNLLCIEFVCHGVGGQKQFDDSIKFIERKREIKILNFVFRDKYKSASSHYYRLEYQDLSTGKFQTKRDIYMTFPYYYAYQDRITCREICYSCPYATENRVGDITIGDFHRVNHYEPDIDRFSGVSMFVCNTKNGEDFFESMQQHLIIKEYDWNVIKMNNRFSGIETPPAYRIDYLSLVANNQIEKAYKKYLNYKMDWRYYYYHMPGPLRQIGNKMLRRAK